MVESCLQIFSLRTNLQERKKEISRNKMERKFVREAQSKRENPLDIRKQLEEIIEAEDAGPLNKALRLRKKVLQEAYDAALKRKKVLRVRGRVGALQVD